MNTINKYPRTFHLTFSPECHNDDKMLDKDDYFLNKEIVITSKLDGSNLCFSKKNIYARSHNGPPTHKSFDFAKQFHKQINHLIDDKYIVYMEYVYAKHSIFYENLPSYFFIFNILDIENNRWLSWDEVLFMAEFLEIPTVPVLFRGVISNIDEFKKLCFSFMKNKEFEINEREGLVVRLTESFIENDFNISMGKMVRKFHVQTSEHWKEQEIVKNRLK